MNRQQKRNLADGGFVTALLILCIGLGFGTTRHPTLAFFLGLGGTVLGAIAVTAMIRQSRSEQQG